MKNLSELSGTELVTVMNEVMAEVKSRLDEGTVTKYVARVIPSTVETADHDGKLLRKVDRKCKTGDYVRFGDKFFKVISEDSYEHPGNKDAGHISYLIKPYPEFFEVVGAVPQKIIKSPNQQRAELIQRAREFAEGQRSKTKCYEVPDKLSPVPWSCDAEFIVNTKNRTVTVLLRGCTSGKLRAKGIAKCMPGDVFNADIGKAIALAKALQIDISQEFLDAIQPSKAVIGTIVERYFVKGEFREVAQNFIRGKTCTLGSDSALHGKIIDDTNAIYESVGE